MIIVVLKFINTNNQITISLMTTVCYKKVSDVNNASLSTHRFAVHYCGMFSHKLYYKDFVKILLLHKQ